MEVGNLFEGLKRIAANTSANANLDVIRYAMERGYLYGDNEYDFLVQTMRKRVLTPAQLTWKKKINLRIIKETVVRHRTTRG